MRRTVRNLFAALLLLIIVLAFWQWELIDYGIMQGRGQFNVLWNARPVEEVMEDPAVPDSLKQRLRLVQEVRDFTVDSLGLRLTENYTTLFDQEGKDILWVVTAVRPYSLEQKQWVFPVVGQVSYKGFFDHERALAEKAALAAEGYDTYLRSVGAWSTLGWFKDPILSNLLFRDEGELVNTIVHELTHGTVFVKDSLDFNENLATFIGHQGALRFISQKWGPDSEQMKEYLKRYEGRHQFSEHILRGLRKLEKLYEELPDETPVPAKESAKQEMITNIIEKTDTLSVNAGGYQKYLRRVEPNNAYFMSFSRYRGEQESLKKQFEQKFNSDLPAFLNYYIEKYER